MKKFLSLFAALLMVGSMMATDLYVVGTINSWSNGNADWVMTETSEDAEWTFDFGETELVGQMFKITDGDWASPYNLGSSDALTEGTITLAEGGSNIGISSAYSSATNVVITLHKDAAGNFTLTAAGTFVGGQAAIPDLYLRGINGSWGAEEANRLVKSADADVWTLTLNVTSGTGFKVADANWGSYNFGASANALVIGEAYVLTNGSNDNISLPATAAAGEYTFTVTKSGDVWSLLVTTELEPEPEPEPVLFKLGATFNEWNADATPSTGNTVSVELEAGMYEFKVVVYNETLDQYEWKGYDEILNTECSDEGLSKNAEWGNIVFTFAEAGTLTVTLGEDGMACVTGPFLVRTITRETFTFHAGPTAEANPAFFIMTSLTTGDPAAETIKMTAGENGTYTAEIDSESQSFYIVRCATGAESIVWGDNVWNGSDWVVKEAAEYWFEGWNAENGWIMDLTTNPLYFLNVTDAGWATMFLPFAFGAAEGTTIYTGILNEDNTALVLTAREQVAANTPVLVQAEQGQYVFSAIEGELGMTETSLYGVTTATAYSAISEETGKTVLTLGVDENETLGFHQPSNGEGSLPANKCCLLYEGNPEAPIRLVFNETTGLKMNAEEVATMKKIVNGTVFVIRNGQMFDLNGRIVK